VAKSIVAFYFATGYRATRLWHFGLWHFFCHIVAGHRVPCHILSRNRPFFGRVALLD